jgi:alpha-galactosidase
MENRVAPASPRRQVEFMSSPSFLSRRNFLRSAAALGAGTVLPKLSSQNAPASPAAAAGSKSGSEWTEILRELPARAYVQENAGAPQLTTRTDNRFTTASTAVVLADGSVRVTCPSGSLSRVILRWDLALPAEAIFLGDHWERSYGDLQWRSFQPERVMPWYFAVYLPSLRQTFMAGVATQPSALCFWTADTEGISLWMDFRNGGAPCIPGDREINAAKLVFLSSLEGENAARAIRRFCQQLCPAPRLPAEPVGGNNNWYYAYGRNFDADAMRRDAAFLSDLAGNHANRPFCVIDAGWTPGSVCPGGPWIAGDAARFPDMPGLAAEMKKMGVRPGIWIRPTALTRVDSPARLRPGPCAAEEKPLDLTLPENIALIHDDVARMRSWGFELIKHDFSTYDIFGKWGFEMGAELTEPGWHFADRSLTNAEIILQLYKTLRDAASDAVLLGCNTIGHLGAGLFEVQRIGDDTSGRQWERTRRMGINTLAFRLAQNGTFFTCDADCAAHTDQTPWEYDHQFLDLVSRSGTALFVSINPLTVTAEQKTLLKQAMQRALTKNPDLTCEAMDWLHTTCPRAWQFNGSTIHYRWEEGSGAWPLQI